MKLVPGQKITLKKFVESFRYEDPKIDNQDHMLEYFGTEVTVANNIRFLGWFNIKEDGRFYSWNKNWIKRAGEFSMLK